jgi:scyllo-inositol 2-dehydrogenase (NADP+)
MTTSTSPISTALLSYGMSGKVFHAPLLAIHPGFRLSTVLQRSADDAKINYPQVKIVRSFEDILKQHDIELVIINTPNNINMSWLKNPLPSVPPKDNTLSN